MIVFPNLNETQLKDLSVMKKTEGFAHLNEILKVSVELAEKSILNYEFLRDDEGKIKHTSINNYEDQQKELKLLKSFFYFLENCDTMGIEEGKQELSEEGEIFE